MSEEGIKTMRCKNKSNISIIRDYVAGVRPVIQVGYTGKKYEKRNIGDRWTDLKGIEWEQLASGPRRINRVADIIKKATGNQKCRCGQEIRFGSKADNLFYQKTGLCEGCLIDYETKLRVLGIYNDYENWKLISNEIGAIKDAIGKITETIKFFETNSGDVSLLCNSEGFTERWKNTNHEKILEDAKTDLKLVTTRLETLIPLRDDYKQKYIDASARYNLEFLCQIKSHIKT